MKKLLGMMSAGRDVSNFFASVVMNIAQDSFEVKVLVYLYLVRTAEQKADEALLSINSFQKDLAHQNPRVRALALRVMSSIRVQVIVPVVILAVRKCAVDPSPYVRKAAAHAIPKVFRLDPKRKDELTEIIETMLRDSTPFVLSSAVAAFQEVCPDRIDLIHRHYRKMCRMLVDCDEWGQILLANLLLRYARTQFTRPDAYDRALTAGGDDDDAKMLELQLPGDGGAFEKASSNPLAGTKGFYSSSDSDSDVMRMRTRTTLGLTRAAAGATATSLAPRSPPRSPRRSPRRSPKSPRRDPRRARSPRRMPHRPPRIAWAPSGSTMTTGCCSGPRDRFSSRKTPPW